MKQTLMPQITEKKELLYARLAAGITILLAGLLGIFPPAFVAQVVAFAFGLAASTLFPVLFMGIFFKKDHQRSCHRRNAYWFSFHI